jgi:hypothetical protein
MTYLELVNSVLRRLREEEVSGVALTPYSKMVGDFVNDAKKIVENSWDWSALRTTVAFTTSEDVYTYSLEDTKDTVKAINVINDTSDFFMDYRTTDWFDNQYYNQEPVKGTPQLYTYRGLDSNGDTQIDVYPKPDGDYVIRFNCVLRNDTLVNDADKLQIPNMPVVHLAVALAARERGETGGTATPEYFAMADVYLSDAIALDAQKHPYATDWYTP